VIVVLSVLSKCVLVVVSLAACALASADNEVVLKARDFVVTTQDFDSYLTEQDITGDKRDRTLAKEGAVRAVFVNIYVVRAFAAEGERNPSIDQAEIDWKVANFRERLLMKQQLQLEVEAELRDTDWDALASEKYKANKADYKIEAQVSAAHILISLTDRTPDEARARANEVVARLQAGEDFNTLAKEYSDDQGSTEKGGELGFFTRNKMVKPFADAAFAMTEPGEISAPVETQFGYHIIRFNKRRPEQQLSFEEAKAQIIPPLKKIMWERVSKDKIAAVKNGEVDFGLEVNLPLLEKYEQRYTAGAESGSSKP
jgi:peptidyl-prolyl cis-trans isomerase C